MQNSFILITLKFLKFLFEFEERIMTYWVVWKVTAHWECKQTQNFTQYIVLLGPESEKLSGTMCRANDK